MDSSDDLQNQIAHDFAPLLRIYKDGRIERLLGNTTVPPSADDPQTGVSSKDIIISPDTGLAARLYLPKLTDPHKKIPVLVYYHGGGFCIESAYSPTYHLFLNSLVAEANVVAVSIEYRLAPEHPLPIAYDDSWAALQWVASHAVGGATGSDAWLMDHGDFSKVVLGGDSAGANIVHDMAMRANGQDLKMTIYGAILIHSFFWGTEAIGKEPKDVARRKFCEVLWTFCCPSSNGCDDPRINPTAEGAPSLKGLGCSRVLVCVAEKDMLRDRGWLYYDALASSGWDGEVEILETEGEDHVFHLTKPTCENAGVIMKRLAAFLNL